MAEDEPNIHNPMVFHSDTGDYVAPFTVHEWIKLSRDCTEEEKNIVSRDLITWLSLEEKYKACEKELKLHKKEVDIASQRARMHLEKAGQLTFNLTDGKIEVEYREEESKMPFAAGVMEKMYLYMVHVLAMTSDDARSMISNMSNFVENKLLEEKARKKPKEPRVPVLKRIHVKPKRPKRAKRETQISKFEEFVTKNKVVR